LLADSSWHWGLLALLDRNGQAIGSSSASSSSATATKGQTQIISVAFAIVRVFVTIFGCLQPPRR
jgi:hypothetical protein